MKAKEPEKLYYAPYGDIRENHPITDNDIEYVRKDTFIEKAEEYLYKQLNEGNMECGDIETFIDEFRNYMKGE